MIEEIIEIREEITNLLTAINSVGEELGIKLDLMPVLGQLDEQLKPLEYYKLKAKIDDQTVFFEESLSNKHSMIAEITNSGLVNYYVCSNTGSIQSANSLLYINTPLVLPLTKAITNKIKKQYQLNIDYDGDTIGQVRQTTYSPGPSYSNAPQNNVPALDYNEANEAAIRAQELIEFNSMKGGGNVQVKTNKHKEGINYTSAMFDQDYTKD